MKDISTIPTLAQPAAGLMLPIQLAQQAADAVRELLAEAAAANTTHSYASALRYWAGWHAARYGVDMTLPVPTPDNTGKSSPKASEAGVIPSRAFTSSWVTRSSVSPNCR